MPLKGQAVQVAEQANHNPLSSELLDTNPQERTQIREEAKSTEASSLHELTTYIQDDVLPWKTPLDVTL